MADNVTTPAPDTTQAGAATVSDPKVDTKAPAAAAPEASAKTAEASPGAKQSETAPTAAKPVAPEKYDFKIPKDSLLDAKHIEKITAAAKQAGLSQEDAQAFLEGEHQAIATFVEERKSTWMKDSIADAEIGGDNLKKNVELAHRVLDKFGSDTLKNELSKTGYGNHPEMVRLLVRLGKAAGEDQLVTPGSTQGGGKRSMEEVFYGTPAGK